MRIFLLTLAFRGTRYHGWQVQKNAGSVSGAVQDAAEAVLGSRPPLTGCSRTDAGVHANGFAASLAAETPMDPAALRRALNAALPPDISVLEIREAPPGFHPRYDARAKRYLYRLYDSPARNPFYEGLALHVRTPLREDRMDAAVRRLLGTHDFSSFCAAGGKIPPGRRIRTLSGASARRLGDLVTVSVTGDGFLYHMVRILVGTLLDVSAGRREPDEMDGILAAGDRSAAGVTVPPWGLYLDRVYYDE